MGTTSYILAGAKDNDQRSFSSACHGAGREAYARWAEQVPDGFRFVIKAHRYLTHNLKLRNIDEALKKQRMQAQGLGDKLAGVLWRLPAPRHVLEFRHASWFDDEVAACLEKYKLALCQSDAADWPSWDRVTTDLVYVRPHGHVCTYASAYDEQALTEWAGRCRRWLGRHDVYLYLDNDAEAAAPQNAQRLQELLGKC